MANWVVNKRHGNPAKAFLQTLRPAGTDDWNKLVTAVLSVLIEGGVDIVLEFPYNAKFPADWPRGIKTKGEGTTDQYRIKARKLLLWLNKHGHTSITPADIHYTKKSFTETLNKFGETLDGEKEIDHTSFHAESSAETYNGETDVSTT